MPRASLRPVVLTVLASVVFIAVIRLQPGGTQVARDADDLGQMASAGFASVACFRRSRRTAYGRRSWQFLAAGAASWAIGEAIWSYFEVLVRRLTPFPSPADLGYLLFPVLAGIGLLLWPAASLRGRRRWRTLLDALLVAGSLFVVTWVTALGEVARTNAATLPYVVSLAYPVTDLVLLTITVVVIAAARQLLRTGLVTLAVGLVCLALADSGFAYLTAVGRYATGSIVDVGWFGGFLLIACAASTSGMSEDREADLGPASTVATLLPYVPAGIALVVAVGGELTRSGQRVTLVAATVVMIVLLIRQLSTVLDERRANQALTHAQAELRHLAFHDPLTGLANRALFTDRLRHGVELHTRDLRPLALLYVDLDRFKTVNDTYGHEAGDVVLRAVGERLRAVTRPGDTVARLGGDEFAVLIEDGGDAVDLAARILDAFASPIQIGHAMLPVRASIGVTELAPGSAPVETAALLHRADEAMYAAKRRGTSLVVTWTPELSGLASRSTDVPASA